MGGGVAHSNGIAGKGKVAVGRKRFLPQVDITVRNKDGKRVVFVCARLPDMAEQGRVIGGRFPERKIGSGLCRQAKTECADFETFGKPSGKPVKMPLHGL